MNLVDIGTSLLVGNDQAVWGLVATAATLVLKEVLDFVTPWSDRITAKSNAFFKKDSVVEGLEAGRTLQAAVADGEITAEEAKQIAKEMRDAMNAGLASRRQARQG